MRIADLMTRDVKCCNATDNLAEAARIMWEDDCGAVPVVDSDYRIVGMVTDRDICMAAYTRGVTLHEMGIQETMSEAAHCCKETDSLETAHRLMRKLQVRRLPVIDEDRRPVGLVGLSDLARRVVELPPGSEAEEAEELVTTYAAVTRPTQAAEQEKSWAELTREPQPGAPGAALHRSAIGSTN